MIRFTTNIIVAFILISLCSCGSTKNISGKYGTNFAVLNFFGTTIDFHQDSTLKYVFEGDLIYDKATGLYHIYNNKVYIKFDKELPDSTKLYHRFDDMKIKTIVAANDSIEYQKLFYMGHNKLFFSNSETGKKIIKARRYNKRRKYILFGSHYYNKRWYLRPINKSS